MDHCAAAGPGSGFISSVTAYVDCQAEMLGSGSWAALSMPGSTLQLVLTGFLTITIALIGYNLLLGTAMTVRSGTLAFVKIGAVFALATSWPAYRTLVYDLVTDGPGQLVSDIGPRAGVVGSDGTLLERLDLADHSLSQLSILGPGNPPPGTYQDIPPAPFGGFDSFALGGSRILFLLTATASLGLVRIVTGLMLALGPFFIAFLMFESTRSLFEGWVRVIGGAAIAAFGVSIALGLELALLEPWLSVSLARRMAGEALPTMPTELFVIVCLFGVLVLAALYACARVAGAFRLPVIVQGVTGSSSRERPSERAVAGSSVESRSRHSEVERTRAAAIASVMRSASHRERAEPALLLAGAASPSRTIEVRQGAQPEQKTVPLGRSFSRRSATRSSALAARRDQGA